MLSLSNLSSQKIDSSHPNPNLKPNSEVNQKNLNLARKQRGLMKILKELTLKFVFANLASTSDEVDQQQPLSLNQLISNMDDLEIPKFIIRHSFSLQRIEQQRLGDRMYATSDMSSIRYILQYPDLVVFDVDDTLIASLDPYFEEHVLPESSLSQQMLAAPEVKRDIFFATLLAIRPWTIIETQTPQLIAEFQSNGTKVIALTALWPVIDKNLNLHIPNWRVRHLKTFGYDFSKSFPTSCLYGFGGEGSQNTLEPYFKKGVMFSGEVPKGKALLSFLRIISFKPRSVLFVDDNINNVYLVYRELSRVGIECSSILYTRTREYPPNSMFSKAEYNSCLQKQEKSIKKFLQLEAILENTTKNDTVGDSTNTPQSMTWLAPSRMSNLSSNNNQIALQRRIEKKTDKEFDEKKQVPLVKVNEVGAKKIGKTLNQPCHRPIARGTNSPRTSPL